MHAGHLYGIAETVLKKRIEEQFERMGVRDRQYDLVKTLSSGLRRRTD